MPRKEKKSTVAPGKKPSAIIAQEKLLALLKSGDLKGGDALKETVLAPALGVTRPAMREALNQAVAWNVVDYLPYKGYRIKQFTIYDLLESYELREALEPIAAKRLALARPHDVLDYLDDVLKKYERNLSLDNLTANSYCSKFHLGVIELCGNKNFAQIQAISSIAMVCYSSSATQEYVWLKNSFERNIASHKVLDRQEMNEITIKKHWELLDCIKSGDANKTEEKFKKFTSHLVEGVRNAILYRNSLNSKG